LRRLIKYLPLFVSFLDTFDKTRSSAVSKPWRDFILSNPTLHQVVFLSNQGGNGSHNHSINLNRITVPLGREAALSKDRLVDVTLELHNLRWEKQKSGGDQSDMDKILTILVPSSDTLRSLDISITDWHWTRGSVDCCHLLGQIDENCPNLQAVRIKGPTPLDLAVGRLVMESTIPEAHFLGAIGHLSVIEIISLMERAVILGKGGLRKFGLCLKDTLEAEDLDEILKQLSAHCSTLTSLDLTYLSSSNPEEAVELISKCQRLETLIFKSHSLQLDDDGTPSFVGTPEEEHEFKFELNFKEKLLNDLQHLQLDLDSRFCRLIWNDTLTSWLCSGRLKSLKLTDVG
jgi:hypothetical protein